MCRWCREPIRLDGGQFVGLDRQPACAWNTAGCGTGCGFTCECGGHGWIYGPHEPLEHILPERGPVNFAVSVNVHTGRGYVLTDGVDAVEWLAAPEHIAIVHGAIPSYVPGDPRSQAEPCRLLPANRCYPYWRPLTAEQEHAFESGLPSIVETAMRKQWAIDHPRDPS